MSTKTVFGILAVLCVVAFGYCIREAHGDLYDYRQLREQEAQVLNFKDRILNLNAWLNTEKKSDGLLQRADEIRAEYQVALADTQKWSLLAGLGILVLVVLAMIRSLSLQTRILSLILAGVCCLGAGLFLPLLEISAFLYDLEIPMNIENAGFLKMLLGENKSFPGHTYFYYQSKSIKEIIVLLLEQKNWVVGLSILAFSILIPLIKFCSSGLILLRKKESGTSRLERVILSLGKWSMADVFVTAIFLSSLAFNNLNPGVQMQSQVLPGIYFFFVYCLLSIWSSVWISNMSHKDP